MISSWNQFLPNLIRPVYSMFWSDSMFIYQDHRSVELEQKRVKFLNCKKSCMYVKLLICMCKYVSWVVNIYVNGEAEKQVHHYWALNIKSWMWKSSICFFTQTLLEAFFTISLRFIQSFDSYRALIHPELWFIQSFDSSRALIHLELWFIQSFEATDVLLT